MFHKKTIRDVDIKGQTVLVRTDFNVPLQLDPDTNEQLVASNLRIRESLPTIQYLLKHQAAKIVLISHLGRPDGKRDQKLSLGLVAQELAEILPGTPVNFVDDVSGPEVEMAVEDLPEGGILLLENLRFSPHEEGNSESFAQEIVDSTHADLFVQDGFAVVHRAHASTVAITRLIPSVAGLLLEKEVITLTKVLESPNRPLVVVIGGAKVADKQPLIDEFLPIADQVFVGGKIAADGYEASNDKVYVAEDFDETETGEKLDIGPVSTTKLIEMIQSAATVLWCGVLGKVEDAAYATSSTILAKFLGEHPVIESIVCGGDTAGFVVQLREDDLSLHYTLISTGGGAALELLTHQDLPGLDGLESA